MAKSSIRKAAEAAGVNERTLRRWLRDSKFQREFRHRRREVLDGAIRLLQSSCAAAVVTLHTIAGDQSAGEAARVLAAGRILDIALRAARQTDLADRMADVERELKQLRKAGGIK